MEVGGKLTLRPLPTLGFESSCGLIPRSPYGYGLRLVAAVVRPRAGVSTFSRRPQQQRRAQPSNSNQDVLVFPGFRRFPSAAALPSLDKTDVVPLFSTVAAVHTHQFDKDRRL